LHFTFYQVASQVRPIATRVAIFVVSACILVTPGAKPPNRSKSCLGEQILVACIVKSMKSSIVLWYNINKLTYVLTIKTMYWMEIDAT